MHSENLIKYNKIIEETVVLTSFSHGFDGHVYEHVGCLRDCESNAFAKCCVCTATLLLNF